MFCTECGKQMILDDFDGNGIVKSKYYICPECKTSCITLCIGKNCLKQEWHSENNNQIRDWTVKNVKS